MDRNPYSAPESSLGAAIIAREKPPHAVTVAIVLLAAIIALSMWGGYDDLGRVRIGYVAPIALLWRALKIFVAIVLCVNIARGRNWARYTQAVIVAFGVVRLAIDYWAMTTQVPAGVTFVVDDDPVQIAWWLLPSVLGLAALVLLFIPGRKWFRRETSQ